MAQEFSRAFYSTAAWKTCRDSYWRKRHGLCEDCLEAGRVTPGTEVHHLEELTLDNINNPAVTLNHDNLRLLCHSCHMKRHGRIQEKRYEVDQATGAIISPPDPALF